MAPLSDEAIKQAHIYAGLKPADLNAGQLKKIMALLESPSVFGGFSHDEAEILGGYFLGYRADKGVAALVEGGQAGYLCLIIDGRLDVIKETSQGHSRKLAEAVPGNTIGEMSMIDGLPPSATVVATEPVLLMVLTRDSLKRILDQHPRLGAKILYNVAQLMSLRLRQTSEELVDHLG